MRRRGRSLRTITVPGLPGTRRHTVRVYEYTRVALARRVTRRVWGCTANRKTATVKTTGNPFMTGTATFTSAKPPKTKTGSCKDESNVKHTYTLATYAGQLTSGSPLLSANFDTGALHLSAPTAARLYVVTYTS